MSDLSSISALCIDFQPCGSRVTCNPPPNDTDIDFLCLVQDFATFEARIVADGWVVGGSVVFCESSVPPDQKFASFTLGNINLIVTESVEFFGRFMAATSVAKKLNLLDKADRIDLFQAVLYGNPCKPFEALIEELLT